VGNTSPDGGQPVSGQAYLPNNALIVRGIHNFNDKFNISLGAMAYDGFVWYFEESEFMPIEGRNSFKFWVNFQERLSDRLWLEIKAAWDRSEPVTNTDVRQYNQPYGEPIDYDFLVMKKNYFRLQLDYIW
jgi:hypothetical protein